MSRTVNRGCVAGVDIGGTKILVGLLDCQFRVLARRQIPTPSTDDPKVLVAAVAGMVRELCSDDTPLQAVGVGVPGFVQRGRVFQAYNIGCDNFPFATALRRRFRVPVYVENDCNLFALGIHRVEFEGKPESLVGLFLGTGGGGGLILNGQLHRGLNGTAGELGQMIVDRDGPRAPNTVRGSLESLASHVGLVHQLRRSIREGQTTRLQKELGSSLRGLTADHLSRAIRNGDRLANRVVHEAGKAVGLGVASLISTLAPERVVLGGGVMTALGGVMLPVIRRTVRANVLPGGLEGTLITQTKLRGDGAIIGAAAWARDNLGA